MYVDGIMTERNGGMIPQIARTTLGVRGGTIGGDRAGSSALARKAFNGAIDELRLYTRPLSHGEILHLANKASVEQPLVPADAVDWNEDGIINLHELALLANIWGQQLLYP
jgi:hypothetical protein